MGGGQPERQRAEPAEPDRDLTEAEAERYKLARLGAMGMALQFGGTTIVTLALCLFGGIWLDRHFGTAPLFLLIGLLLAFATVGYNLYQLATVKTGPARRRTATTGAGTPPRRSAGDWDDKDERDEDDDWPVRRRTGG